MDRRVTPRKDFDRFANGAWKAPATPFRAKHGEWVLTELNGREGRRPAGSAQDWRASEVPEGFWRHPKSPRSPANRAADFGAGNETRTRDPDLGKVVLYQLSYSRMRCTHEADWCPHSEFGAGNETRTRDP